MTTSAPALPALTAATFDEAVATAEGVLLVDVWAAWCGPCGPMGEAVAAVAADHPAVVQAASIDADAQPDLARRFDVLSLPTLLVFRHGELVDRLVGARGRARLTEDLAVHLTALGVERPA